MRYQKKPHARGTPARIITDEMRDDVIKLATAGLHDETIAQVVDLSRATLQRRCRKELNKGRANCKALLAKTAMQMAISGKHPNMTIFMCKVHLRWKEPKDEYEEKDKKNYMDDLVRALAAGPVPRGQSNAD